MNAVREKLRWPGDAGVWVYGLGAMFLGAVGLASGDFAGVWQPVPTNIPARTIVAYGTALCFLAAGAAVPWRRMARPCSLTLGAFYVLFTALWLPRVVAHPQIFGTWGGVFEQLSLATAAIVVYVSAAKSAAKSSSTSGQLAQLLYGICAVAFGLNHFFAIPETARMVPSWIPPSQHFWAVATGVAHLLAGMALLWGVLAVSASRLLTLMLLSFGALVWLPMLIAHPRDHTVWSGNAINLAMAGAAWVIADWVAAKQTIKGNRLSRDPQPKFGYSTRS